MDDEYVPESLSALLGLDPGEASGAATITVASAIAHLISTRNISARRARRIVTMGRCDECPCTLGEIANPDECECPCHCTCCCPPTFHCLIECECACDCHYAASSDDEENSQDSTQRELAQATSNLQGAASSIESTTTREQGEHGGRNANSALHEHGAAARDQLERGRKTSEDTDDDMQGTAPLNVDLGQLSATQLAELLGKQLSRTDDQAETNARQVLRAIFADNYGRATQGKRSERNPNKHLPELTSYEMDLLYDYVATLYGPLKYSMTRITGAIRDLAVASVRSTWKLANIIDQRAASAKLPREPPTNVWSQGDGDKTAAAAGGLAHVFRFDERVYTQAEIARYKAVCEQEHAFATATREPSEDEWRVLEGMLSGTIIASAMPQFLKRCCTITQLVWFHDEIIQRAEGELWVALPPMTKIYNFNQTTRRLAAEVRQSAKHHSWVDTRLEEMLSKVKSIAYNPDLHSVHFFFYSKEEAVRFEDVQIPFRASKLPARNPDTKLRRSENSDGLPTDDDDGLVNDRYQARYKCSLFNVPRTFDLQAVIAFLQSLTRHGLKSAVPLDTYGQHAEGSVSWDLFAVSGKCPAALEGINRIDWVGHPILIQHRANGGRPTCLQCAQVGHQAAVCPTPKEDWNTTTLVVSADEAAKFSAQRKNWKTMDDLRAVFASLRHTPSEERTDAKPVAAPPSNELGDSAPANEDQPTSVVPPGESESPENDTRDAERTSAAAAPVNDGAFKTHKKKSNGKRKTNRNKASSELEETKGAAPSKLTAPLNGKPASVTVNRFIDLLGSDEEQDGDDEKEGTVDEETKEADSESESIAGEGSKGSTAAASKTTDPASPTDEAEIERAIQQARMERVRAIIDQAVDDHARSVDVKLIQEAVDRAWPHITDKASVEWILETIGGRLTSTPQTGNCQYYVEVEALLQRDLRLEADPEDMVNIVRILKLGLLMAHNATTEADRQNNQTIAILDLPKDTPVTMTPAEQQRRITEFYGNVARSSSELSELLPAALWGSVIFDRAKPATAAVTKKLKTAKLDDLWNKTAPARPAEPAAATKLTGASRKQVVESSVNITENDMLSFLLDNGWSTAEKKEIVDILVSGDVNYKQLLTFTTTGSGTESEEPSDSTQTSNRTETSEYTPHSDTDESTTTATPSSTLAEQGSKEYRQWADEMWRGVQDEWHQQTNTVLPDLLDTAGLTALIHNDPGVLLEVGRWCDNPLTMLEHIPMVNIQEWMEPQWVKLCISCFESIIEDIMDATTRVLDAWVAGIKAATTVKAQKKAIQVRSKWTLMKKQVPKAFKGRNANPLLTYDYTMKAATILVLDALLPDLARQILGNVGWKGDLATVTLVTAYQCVPEFRKAIDQAEEDDEWDPVEHFYNALQRQRGEAAARC